MTTVVLAYAGEAASARTVRRLAAVHASEVVESARSVAYLGIEGRKRLREANLNAMDDTINATALPSGRPHAGVA